MKSFSWWLILALWSVSSLHSQERVERTEVATHPVTGVRIARGMVELPVAGRWLVEEPLRAEGGVTERFAMAMHPGAAQVRGSRSGRLSDRRAINERRDGLRRFYRAIWQYADDHGGWGPDDQGSLLQQAEENRGPYLESLEMAEGHVLLGGVRLFVPGEDGRRQRLRPPRVLAFDCQPAIEDGKHWVVNTNGELRRVAVDAALLAGKEVTLKPQRKPFTERALEEEAKVAYHLYARLLEGHGEVTLSLRDGLTGHVREVVWDTSEPVKGEADVIAEWARLRSGLLMTLSDAESPLARHWVRQWNRQYGLGMDQAAWWAGPSGEPRRGRTATAMGVLGGRAAIQETLQLRSLAVDEGSARQEARIPVGTLPGIEVKSHPFEEMLQEVEEEGDVVPLMQWVPVDRFVVYCPGPEGLLSLLEGGSAFVHEAGASVLQRKALYALKARYLQRLGLSEALMKQVLEAGMIQELAVILPDLFLIDGTEMTVVARARNPLLAKAALALLGVPMDGSRVTRKNARGESVHWSLSEDVIVISSSETEADYVKETRREGVGLGMSVEFRYMLTQLPLTKATRIYTYFSDPFIRRLVGPEVKIGQVRRLQARLELEEATAASLMARFDGQGGLTVPELIERNYLQEAFRVGPMSIDAEGGSHSEAWGRAARLVSLEANPVETVSEAERRAYEVYRELYDRYWRRFFDPIALRYEAFGDGTHELGTFILPLVDNSLYNGLKEVLVSEEDARPLMVPQLHPEPVAMLSFNLNEESWLDMIEDLSEMLEQLGGWNGSLLDQLGPDFHVAVADDDPVIAIGSGELGGLLGRFGGRLDADSTMIPFIVSLLTRPTSFLIGLQDPEVVSAQLDSLATFADQENFMGFGDASLYRVRGENKWIYRFSVEDLITLRLGIEVKDRYLVISNAPFSPGFEVSSGEPAPHRAAFLSLSPRACVKQLPALFASAVEQQRASALRGASSLFPLLMSGRAASVEEAQALHAQWFGFEPSHPAGGHWEWKGGRLESSLYGLPWKEEQPAYDPSNEQVGVLNRVSQIDLSMQFEHDGLRSTARWRLKPEDKE